MIEEWLGTSPTEVWLVAVSSISIILGVILIVRLNGLRSFSKMSSFDFAVTVAVGSLVATVAVSSTSLLNGLIGLLFIMGTQRLVAEGRKAGWINRLVDNRPMLLMAGTEVLHDHLTKTRVTTSDLKAKLREANVLDINQVQAVVLETTGDISVLHGTHLDPALLDGVIGAERMSNGTE